MIARLSRIAGILALALACAPLRARAQETAYRFEITTVGDSTVSLSTERHEWVKEGQKGIAVDPMRHDALVARFTILHVDPVHKLSLIHISEPTRH